MVCATSSAGNPLGQEREYCCGVSVLSAPTGPQQGPVLDPLRSELWKEPFVMSKFTCAHALECVIPGVGCIRRGNADVERGGQGLTGCCSE